MVTSHVRISGAPLRAFRRARGVSTLALALALAACGGGGGGGGGSPISTPPPAPAPAPTPAPAPAPAPTPPPSTFNTAEYRRSEGPEQHGAITAWEAGRTGAGQTIAIVDTGIDTTNTEFAGRILPASRDVTTGGRSIQAEDDHGTNVALVASAARNNSGVMGIAFDASLLVLRADQPGSCADSGANTNEASCSFFDSSIARGVDAAVAAGARVVNLSLGGSGGIGGALQAAVQRASAAGVVVVVAAGNGGAGNRPNTDPNQPTAFAQEIRAAGGNNVIIVGSVDEGSAFSSFSQRAGNEAAWFLSARGERICCVYEGSQIYVGQDAGGSFNLLFSGTSFATPQVAGAVALLAQAFPNLTGQQLVRILLDSARDAGAAGTDATYGRGILDITAALAPRGAMTLAGGITAVRVGMDTGLGSAAMGDALATSGPVQGVVLDSYQRAYALDLASGLRGAAVQPRLRAALAGGTQMTGAAAGGVSLAFTIGEGSAEQRNVWARQLQLSGEQAEGARLLAARVAARIAPDAEMAFGLRESAQGLVAQLQGARQPAFLIAGDAADDSGFQRAGAASFALRRQFGRLGITASAESGAVWRNDNLRAAEALPGGQRERFGYHSFALSAERRLGPVDALLGANWLSEDASVLGATFAPAFGMGGADTLFLDASAGMDVGAGWRLGAAWRQGFTRVRQAGLVAEGSALSTSGWSLDVSRGDMFARGDSFGLRLSQPLRVTGGGIGLTLPVAYDYATLLPSYGTRFIALAPAGREIDAEVAWRGPLWGGNASASLYYRTDPGHYASLPDDKGVAVRWHKSF